MGGGGGGGGGNDWTYFQNIQQDKDKAAAKQAQDVIDKAAADKAAAESTFQTKLTDAQTNAWNTAATYFKDRGIPWDENLVRSIIGQVSVPDLDVNPASYFKSDIFATGVSKAEEAQRQKYSNYVDQYFTPGFEKSLIPDTSVDPIVNSILGSQRGTAQQVLDYNQRRGLVNDVGYNTARDVLGQQESAGRSTLMDLANSVLGKYRGGLTDIRGEAGTAASGYNYGATAPDFSSYYKRASDLASKDLSGLEGSIRGALGGTNLFDVPTALAKGGTAQGPINLTTAGTTPGVAPLADRTKVAQRGLGSTGVF